MSSSTNSPNTCGSQTLRFPHCLGLAVAAVVAVMTCHYFSGENASIRIHDCLDSLIPTTSVFAKSDVFATGGNAIFEPLLGGVPRNCFGSEGYDGFALPAREPFSRLCLQRVPRADRCPVRHGAAAAALRLAWGHALGECRRGLRLRPAAVLSVRPLHCRPTAVVLCGLEPRRDHKPASLLVVALFPFFSNLVLIGFVLVPALAIYLAYRRRVMRRLNICLLAALTLLTGGYLVCSCRLFLNWFGQSGYISMRSEFGANAWTLKTALKTAALDLLQGQYHAASMQFPFILLATFFAMAVCVAKRSPEDRVCWRHGWKGILGEENNSPAMRLVVVLSLINALLSLVRGLAGWHVTAQLIEASHIRFLRTFQYDRVYWLHPALWGIVFACALEHILRKVRSGRLFAGASGASVGLARSRHP